MSAQVGQTVQYFDSRGYGPFAATVLAVDEGAPETPQDMEEGAEDFSGSVDAAPAATAPSVSLEYTKVSKHGTVTRTFRKGIVELGTEAHDAASAAIPEGAEVCGLPKKARGFKAIA